MADDCKHIEEHELPAIEAALAGTLALMTGYSQALQAALHPQQRLAMGDSITHNLALLADQPLLSTGFRQVLLDLQTRWRVMGACTRDAAGDIGRVTPSRPGSLSMDSAFEVRGPLSRRLH